MPKHFDDDAELDIDVLVDRVSAGRSELGRLLSILATDIEKTAIFAAHVKTVSDLSDNP